MPIGKMIIFTLTVVYLSGDFIEMRIMKCQEHLIPPNMSQLIGKWNIIRLFTSLSSSSLKCSTVTVNMSVQQLDIFTVNFNISYEPAKNDTATTWYVYKSNPHNWQDVHANIWYVSVLSTDIHTYVALYGKYDSSDCSDVSKNSVMILGRNKTLSQEAWDKIKSSDIVSRIYNQMVSINHDNC